MSAKEAKITPKAMGTSITSPIDMAANYGGHVAPKRRRTLRTKTGLQRARPRVGDRKAAVSPSEPCCDRLLNGSGARQPALGSNSSKRYSICLAERSSPRVMACAWA